MISHKAVIPLPQPHHVNVPSPEVAQLRLRHLPQPPPVKEVEVGPEPGHAAHVRPEARQLARVLARLAETVALLLRQLRLGRSSLLALLG